MENYTEYCERCITGLYRTALAALGSRDAAADCVRRVCSDGVELCAGLRTEREVKVELTRRLYALCSDTLGADGRGALLVALRFASGLRSDEALAASGLPKEQFYRLLARAACEAADLRSAPVGAPALIV